MTDGVDGGAARLPEELADLPPGPRLSAVLAEIDPARLNGHDLVELAAAHVRLISHLQAGLATVLDQAAHCPPGDADSAPDRTDHINRWAELDLAAKLRWSAGKASYELRYAHHLTRRLPMVHAALAAGVIDWPRARIIVDGVACLDGEPARQIAAHVLTAGAPEWSTRRLAGTVRRSVIAFDPAAAATRQRQRLSQRWVQADPHPDGTADLHGMHLPPERVTEIIERITAIARTAKRQGDTRAIDQLKADALCDLLAGTGVGATPPGPVTDPESPFSTDVSARREVAKGTTVPLPGPRRGVVELTAPLSGLISASQAPGEIAGYGPVIADVCRQIAAQRSDAQWRFSIYDDLTSDGQLAYHGITHARPTPAGDGGVRGGFAAADLAFVRARDRTCRGPQGCHAPASGCDLDHTVAKVDGGGHHRGNAGPLCRREHMFKHQSAAVLRQPEPGVFEWTTPFGHHYTVRPDPYHEATGPPAPADRPHQRFSRLFALAA